MAWVIESGAQEVAMRGSPVRFGGWGRVPKRPRQDEPTPRGLRGEWQVKFSGMIREGLEILDEVKQPDIVADVLDENLRASLRAAVRPVRPRRRRR